jgi:transposase
MVWECFAWHGVGRLYRVEGIMEQKQYQNILKNEMLTSARQLFPDNNFIFQQDNDPKHTSNLCKNYLATKRTNVLKWPARSPDLNPIENLWSILNTFMKDRKPQTREELFEILTNAWNNFPVNILNRLVESMPCRIEAIIKKNGFPTKY